MTACTHHIREVGQVLQHKDGYERGAARVCVYLYCEQELGSYVHKPGCSQNRDGSRS